MTPRLIKIIAIGLVIVGLGVLAVGVSDSYSESPSTVITVFAIIIGIAVVAGVSFIEKLHWLRVPIAVVIVAVFGFAYCGGAMEWLDHNTPGQREYRERLRQHAKEEGLNPDGPTPSATQQVEVSGTYVENAPYKDASNGKTYLYFNGKFHLITNGQHYPQYHPMPTNLPSGMFGQPLPNTPPVKVVAETWGKGTHDTVPVEGRAYCYADEIQERVYLFKEGKFRLVPNPSAYTCHLMPEGVRFDQFGPPLP